MRTKLWTLGLCCLLLLCPSLDAKDKKKHYEPLFGKAQASYSVTSSSLKGAVFYLVSGHGGPDPGCIGHYQGKELHEDEYAYDIILRLGRELLRRGAKVYFIIQDKKDGIRETAILNNSKRETCMGKPIPLNQVARLRQRGSKYGKRLATQLQKTFRAKYDRHQPNRGFDGTVSERNLFVLRTAIPYSVFMELGNIQNKQDQKRLVIPSNRQALANWITDAIVADYKKSK